MKQLAQEFDLKGLQKQRRKKKLKKLFKKLIIVLIILCIGAVVYLTRKNWLPFFNGIATRYIPASTNTGELATGQFPIKIQGGADYLVSTLDNNFALVDDTHFYIYNSDADLILQNNHDYANPYIRTNRSKALMYDIGGNKFCLTSKYKEIYNKTIDDKILFARLSNSDYAAVVTSSDKNISFLSIYNPTGDVIYTWRCTMGRIIDVTFSPTSDGCYVSTFDSKDGQIVSQVSKFLFNSDKIIWSTDCEDAMPVSSAILYDGTIAVVGDTKCLYYSKDGSFIKSYEYPYDLVDYSISSYGVSLILRNEELRKTLAVNIQDMDNINTISLEDNAKAVYSENDSFYVLTDREVKKYTNQCVEQLSVKVNYDYYDFFKINSYVYLMSDSDIDRVDFVG